MMSKLCKAAFGAGLVLLGPGNVTAQGTFPFQNPSLPTSQRVADLVSRMTLEEKAAQMGTDAPAITLTPDQLRLLNAQGQRTLQPHDWQVSIGGSQPGIMATGQAKGGVSQTLHIN